MRTHISKRLAAVIVLLAVSGLAFSGEGIVSTMQNMPAYMEYNGYSIQPIGTTTTPGDQGPTQLFQIVRPTNARLTIGRLFTSCTCIQLSAEKKTFGGDESVILTLRNVRPTSGKTYPFYVQLTSPVRVTLRYDTYVISDSYAAPKIAEEAATPQPVEVPEAAEEESPPESEVVETEEAAPAVEEKKAEEDAAPAVEEEKAEAAAGEESKAAEAPEEKETPKEAEADTSAPKEPAAETPESAPSNAEEFAGQPPLREVNASAISILERTMKAEKKP